MLSRPKTKQKSKDEKDSCSTRRPCGYSGMAQKSIPFRSLGHSGIAVSALGLGCMGMSFAYGPTDEAESLRVLRRYLEIGGNFLDTAEIYGPYTNEELVGRFLREVSRESVVVATKFGFRFNEDQTRTIDGSPAN